MIYLNLISIPINAYIAGAVENDGLKSLNIVATLVNMAVVAAHLAPAA